MTSSAPKLAVGLEGISTEQALSRLEDMTDGFEPIGQSEYQSRIAKAQKLMKKNSIDATLVHAGTNLEYFTGLKWNPSERMVAAIIPAEGSISYIAPQFEIDTVNDFLICQAPIHTWEEHESPYQLVWETLSSHYNLPATRLAADPAMPYFMIDGLLQIASKENAIVNGTVITQGCRETKSAAELRLIQQAHRMTLTVIQAAASILKPGISTTEVTDFIDKAHRKVGSPTGSFFAIALFGKATSFPHGVKDPQILQENDWVLIDTGFRLHGYHSDITRTFCYGTPTERQRNAWNSERDAQQAAFDAVQVGAPCEVADLAARRQLEKDGYGPEYQLPGLPHRCGHGCGLDIHEGPFLVKGETKTFQQGMVFSNEPMLVLPGEFGVRLEDHFFLTVDGPQWVTQPAINLDDPFNLQV